MLFASPLDSLHSLFSSRLHFQSYFVNSAPCFFFCSRGEYFSGKGLAGVWWDGFRIETRVELGLDLGGNGVEADRDGVAVHILASGVLGTCANWTLWMYTRGF